MKVGLVIYGSLEGLSGGYLYDRKLVDHLRTAGDTVEIISLSSRNYLAHLADNLDFRLPPGLDILVEDELAHPSLLTANIQQHPYPVISLVHNLHSSEFRFHWQRASYARIEKYYLNSVDGFIFNSTATRDSVHKLAADHKPFVVATPGGNRLGALTADRARARAFEGGPLRLLFLANVIPLKGLHVLLEAISCRPAAYVLDIVGSLRVNRAYVHKMQKVMRAKGLSSMVHFHENLDGAALIEKIENAQVLVLPSFYEGFGIAILEGMAFGLPAISTMAGAIPQLITDGENGFLILAGDSDKLAQRLTQLASDRALLCRLSLGALSRFHAQPTWEQTTEAIRTFLFQVIERNL
jgi:glycosyltransferase involved in cell wall biosynthesis